MHGRNLCLGQRLHLARPGLQILIAAEDILVSRDLVVDLPLEGTAVRCTSGWMRDVDLGLQEEVEFPETVRVEIAALHDVSRAHRLVSAALPVPVEREPQEADEVVELDHPIEHAEAAECQP